MCSWQVDSAVTTSTRLVFEAGKLQKPILLQLLHGIADVQFHVLVTLQMELLTTEHMAMA